MLSLETLPRVRSEAHSLYGMHWSLNTGRLTVGYAEIFAAGPNDSYWPVSDHFDRRPVSISYLCLFGHFDGIVNFDAQVANCAFKLRVTQQ